LLDEIKWLNMILKPDKESKNVVISFFYLK